MLKERILIKILLLLLFPVLLIAHPADIQFEHISINEGLSQGTVRCIFQDSRGFMWFGTQDGLNRYDGLQFKKYKHEPDDTTSLKNNTIFSICEDNQGKLWIGTEIGLDLFNRETETFTHFNNSSQIPYPFDGYTIWSLYADAEDVLWIGTNGAGLYKLDLLNWKNVVKVLLPIFQQPENHTSNIDSIKIDNATSFLKDKSGNFWAGNFSGLMKFDNETKTFSSFLIKKSDSHYWFARAICEDKQGNLWIEAGKALHFIPFNSDKAINFQTQPFISTHFYKYPSYLRDWKNLGPLLVDRLNTVWIGTRFGPVNFNPQTEQFTLYQNEPDKPHSFHGNQVKSIFEDRSGVVWFGSFEDGINKCYPNQVKFTRVKHEPGLANSLSHNFVMAIYEDDSGTLWVGANGLNKIVRNQNRYSPPQFTHYQHDNNNPNSLSGNDIRSIIKDKSGMLWIGTFQKGLNKFNPQTGDFTVYKHDPENPNSISDNNVWIIHKDKSGELWLGTRNGLNKFIRETESFVYFHHESQAPENPNHDWITCIAEDDSGIFWLGTNGGGLKRFDPRLTANAPDKFAYFKHDPNNLNSLSDERIRSLLIDQSGFLWIGTASGSLDKFDSKQNIFTHFNEKDGFPGSAINGILEDGASPDGAGGNLWISTNNGFFRFNPETKTLRSFDTRDGLQGLEFNGGSYFKSPKTGEMFFGGTNGFNSFFPKDIKDNPYAPQIVITDFQISNQSVPVGSPYLPNSITESREIIVPHNERVLSFEFAALHYPRPEKNEYAYKMEGLDEDWNYIGHRNFTTFTNLAPGQYTFRVKGSNCDGLWNETGTSLRIIVTPPWWRTWWAYILYFLFTAAIIGAYIRFSINRALLKRELVLKQKHAEKLEELDQMKSNFFANISHEFRTPLTLILGPLERLLAGSFEIQVKKQFNLMLRNGQRLLRLINQLLDLSKMEAGRMALRTRAENIVKLVNSTVLFFSSMAEQKEIRLSFQATQELIEVYVDRDKLEKIFTNLLSNAFKFTSEEGEISVTIKTSRDDAIHLLSAASEWKKKWESDFVEISVADTGTGIPPERLDKIFNRFYQVGDSATREQGGTGIGLALTKELVELHHGEIIVNSPLPGGKAKQGTMFTVRFPLGKDHLKAGEIITDLPVDNSKLKTFDFIKNQLELEEIQAPEGATYSDSFTHAHQKENVEFILIVDDNQDVREYIRGILDETWQIIEGKNGIEGLEVAQGKNPDLIISDVMMPEMDGFEFCAKIKSNESTCHIPVILLTARASGENKLEGLETGADDYLTKPFDAQELIVRVKNLIEGRRRLRKKFSREISVQPKDITVTSMDEEFLKRAMEIVEAHISDSEFTTENFAWEIGMSRMTLNRKLQALTEETTHGFIRTLRLKRAAQLLQQGAGTVTEIVYDVGFNNLSHFAKAFRQQFGQSPSEYAAKHQQDS